MSLPRVFLDVTANGVPLGLPVGRLVIELFTHIVPRTAENFRALCTGEKGYGYKNSPFHSVVPNSVAKGGDFVKQNGTAGRSIYAEYGQFFEDENFIGKHSEPYILSMVNKGPNTNSSLFSITFNRADYLDGKQVVFGKLVDGFSNLKKIEAMGSQSGKTSQNIVIVNCGEL